MEQTVEEFFHDFRQGLLAGAEANGTYQLESFMDSVSTELIETGFVEGYEHCHYRAQRGMQVDGYWFDDEGVLSLFVADFDCRRELETLTRKDAEAGIKRLVTFFEASLRGKLDPDVTTPEYGLARQIAERRSTLRQVSFFLVSERVLSDKVQAIPDDVVAGIRAVYHIWDIARFQRQRSSRGHKEALDIDFVGMFGSGINCLPANLGSDSYKSFLIVMPAPILADLYGKYSARLLEQNVRTFLQARGDVNKGIRTTILKEPEMFFAYNNGITATAQEVKTLNVDGSLQVVSIKDLQIVNGGQTTASLFHTQRRDKADLSRIFVQMKLSVIDSEQSELVVPRISEYANTQNRVNAADFFANHPFHVRMAEFSRRIWAPAQKGVQRETKWFYERARGQYLDAQLKLTTGEQKRFKAEYPKAQMFTKTDLAKFENVFDDHPKWVNMGSQKNFAQYAKRIGGMWEESSLQFNELYFQRVIARAILFRTTEKLISDQKWYSGGYRANIVAYTLALLGEIVKTRDFRLNFQQIWSVQAIEGPLLKTLPLIAESVYEVIMDPPPGISNISEWSKKEACWTRIKDRMDDVAEDLPDKFWNGLLSEGEVRSGERSAKKNQRLEDGIQLQAGILNIPRDQWTTIRVHGVSKNLLTPKEVDILRIAEQIPAKLPTDKQCIVLAEVLQKAMDEGIV